MTYVQLQINGLPSSESTEEKSQSFPQDSRANLIPLQEKVSAIVTSVTCGGKLQECSQRLNRNGLSVKIRPVYSQGKISDSSDECSTTLPRWGIALVGEYGELVTSERRIKETECLLWRTPMASDGIFTNRTETQLANRLANGKSKQKHLSEQVAYVETFPTPLSSDSIRVRYSEKSLRKVGMRRTHGEYKKAGCNLSEYVAVFSTPPARGNMSAGNGGKLNPTWVEWLMGFPIGWTDLNASETQ